MKITLIGSTRFERAFKEANKRLTCAGHVVYSVACLSHSEGLRPTEDQAAMYDLTHLAKIVASDAVLVLDVNGYLGKSCKREIAWAQMTGKILSYLSTGGQQINPGVDLSDLRDEARIKGLDVEDRR